MAKEPAARGSSRSRPSGTSGRRSPGSRRTQSTAEQPTAPPAQPSPAAERVLRRSRDDRVLAGVAGGLGRYLGIDAVVVRLAFVVLAIASFGIGLLLYILAWILIPEEREGDPLGPRPAPERRVDVWVIVGVGLIGIGGILLINRLFPGFDRVTAPLILIALGAAVLVQGLRR